MRRNTIQRETILRILSGTKSHPTADQIYDEVRKKIPNISKGTVYRNLKVLQELGQIRELNLNGTISRFEVMQSNHYHFRCENCGKVLDLDLPIQAELDHQVAEGTGLKISYHQLEFRGLCHDCQSSISKKSARNTARKR